MPRANILGISGFQLSPAMLTSQLPSQVFHADAKRSTAGRALLHVIGWFTHIHISMLCVLERQHGNTPLWGLKQGIQGEG